MQAKIDTFTTTIKKPPLITKSGLKEFILELVADANLVSIYLSFRYFITQSKDSHFILLNANLFATPSDMSNTEW